MKRIYSIDVMRGIVMIIMALDHVRDLMHTTSLIQQPTNLATTTPALFFTRWITHLCAPVFVFLSGVSVFLSIKRTSDIQATRRFLLTRGVWFIFLEFTVITFSIWFDSRFQVFLSNVIGAIGFGFIILSLLLNCSSRTIGLMGVLIIFLHNLTPLIPGPETSLFKQIVTPLFAQKVYPLSSERLFVVGYPPIPWLGIILVGFALGRYFEMELKRQRSFFLKLGLSAIALFILLRVINIYGDSLAWAPQKNDLFTFLSFINLTKYPPSLDFCLLFLGIMCLIYASIQGIENKWTEFVVVFGKVPLFYFLVHWYVIHLFVFLMLFLQGVKAPDMVFGFNFGRPISGSGIGLAGIYLVWVTVVLIMYPICWWYGKFKQAHWQKKWWLKYL
jgi:uncharacterized membrane protein